jgi:hypothetical protein
MNPNEHPKSHGALFVNNDKQQENHPDFRGNVEISNEQIHRLIEMSKAGMEVKIQLAGWWRQPASGGATYMSLRAEAYMKPASTPQYPPQQQYAPQQPPVAPHQTPPAQPQQVGYAPPAGVPGAPAPQQRAPAPQPVTGAPASDFDFDDDIPF